MTTTARVKNGSVTLPRAVIPPLPAFELVSPPWRLHNTRRCPHLIGPPSRGDFLIAEIERRFGGSAVCVELEEEFPEFGEPGGSAPEPSWKKHVLPNPVEDDDGEPVLGDGSGEGQEQAREMYRLGLKLKAQRLACCGRFGRRLECVGVDQHSFFEPFNCGLRTCQRCAPLLARKLFDRLSVLETVVKSRSGWTLALLDFTLRNDGNLPDGELIRQTNLAVKRTMHRLLRGVAGWGYLWIDEFGFDNTNFHVHGIYYGPYLSVSEISAAWTDETEKLSGELGRNVRSYRVWIQKVRRNFRAALFHHLGYVSKPPSNDPHRLAELEAAFHRVRKVHTLGVFYDPEIGDVSEEEMDSGGSQRCPYCGEFLAIVSGFCPVSELESCGLINVNVVRRGEFLKRMGTEPP